MQTVDSHCHFWQLDRGDYGWLDGEGGHLQPIRHDFLPADYPVDQRLIVVQAAPSLAETDFLLSLAESDSRIAGVVGWVDLSVPETAETLGKRARNPLLKGIRPMLQDIAESEWIMTAPDQGAVEALVSLGLRFDALVTSRHLPHLLRFVEKNDALPVIIDHAAKPQKDDVQAWQEGMKRLAANGRIYCKLSGLLTEFGGDDLANPEPRLRMLFGQLLDWFGPGRIVWGSDWPVLTLAASFERWSALTEMLLRDLSPAERDAIMGGNARRFYGLE